MNRLSQPPPRPVDQMGLDGDVREEDILDGFPTAHEDADAPVAVADDQVLELEMANVARRPAEPHSGGAACDHASADCDVLGDLRGVAVRAGSHRDTVVASLQVAVG